MTIVGLFQNIDPAVAIGFVTSLLIPYLSALLTTRPSAVTGAVTLLLSTVSGVLSTFAAHPSHFDWTASLGAALASWLIAVTSHKAVLKGTTTETVLHNAGVHRT